MWGYMRQHPPPPPSPHPPTPMVSPPHGLGDVLWFKLRFREGTPPQPPPPVACGLGYVLWFKLRFREGTLPPCGLWPVAPRKVKRKSLLYL